MVSPSLATWRSLFLVSCQPARVQRCQPMSSEPPVTRWEIKPHELSQLSLTGCLHFDRWYPWFYFIVIAEDLSPKRLTSHQGYPSKTPASNAALEINKQCLDSCWGTRIKKKQPVPVWMEMWSCLYLKAWSKRPFLQSIMYKDSIFSLSPQFVNQGCRAKQSGPLAAMSWLNLTHPTVDTSCYIHKKAVAIAKLQAVFPRFMLVLCTNVHICPNVYHSLSKCIPNCIPFLLSKLSEHTFLLMGWAVTAGGPGDPLVRWTQFQPVTLGLRPAEQSGPLGQGAPRSEGTEGWEGWLEKNIHFLWDVWIYGTCYLWFG